VGINSVAALPGESELPTIVQTLVIRDAMYMDSEFDTEMLLRGTQACPSVPPHESGYDAAKCEQPTSVSVAAMIIHSIGEKTLPQSLKCGNSLLMLVRVTGICVLLCLVFVAGRIYYDASLYPDNPQQATFITQYLILDTMLFLGIQSVLPPLYFNYFRLLEPATTEHAAVMQECCKVAAIFGAASSLFLVVALAMACFFKSNLVGSSELIGITLLSAAVVVALMINLVLLLLDVKLSQRLLDQLHTLADQKLLTLEKFNATRDEIHRGVAASRFACDYVLAPALASVVGVVSAILLLSEYYYAGVTLFYCAFMAVQLKELFYVAVAFVYVARVNACADELTAKLSVGMWGQYIQIGSTSTGNLPDPELQLSTVADMHRVSIYMSAKENPISFTLMFTRLSWRSVIASAVALVLSLLIGTIRSIVISQVA
jgi:uncharacterized membrane protein